MPDTVYVFRVAGFTSKGRGEFSTEGSTRTEPRTPGTPPKFGVDKEIVDGKTAIRVKWHLPEDKQYDKIDKYR